MLLASKAIAQLLLPPGGLVLLGIAGLLLWRRKVGRWLVATSLLLFWLLATAPVRDALLEPLEAAYPPLQEASLPKERTAIVLLGGSVYASAPEYGGRDALRDHALARTLYAADLASRTGLDVYASGGAVLSDTEPEGAVMRRWLIRFGVPAERIHAETAAHTTWENAARLRTMLAAAGIRHTLLVTSAFHMPRAVWSFKRQGMVVMAAPCDYRTDAGEYDLRDFLPNADVFANSCLALHEYLGRLWYALRFG